MGPKNGDPPAGRAAFRALVADDSEFARRNAGKLIALLGGEVVGEAATGRQAVDRYRILRPDLVIMDITMPEMQGLEAVETIMQEDPGARIVMVTSVGHQEVVRRALGLGARYFLMKPLQFDEAAAALRFVLETPASPGGNGEAPPADAAGLAGAEGAQHAG